MLFIFRGQRASHHSQRRFLCGTPPRKLLVRLVGKPPVCSGFSPSRCLSVWFSAGVSACQPPLTKHDRPSLRAAPLTRPGLSIHRQEVSPSGQTSPPFLVLVHQIRQP